MKVCHITQHFPPGWGGEEVHNYTLAKWLLRRGYSVEFIVLRKPGVQYEQSFSGIPVVNIPANKKWRLNLWKAIIKGESGESKILFDVHKISYFPYVRHKRRAILSLHTFELTCPLDFLQLPPLKGFRPKSYPDCNSCLDCVNCVGLKSYLHWKLVSSYVTSKVSKVVVKYPHLKKKLISNGINPDKIILIPNWLDVEYICRKRTSGRRLSHSEIIFAFLGRINSFKGVDLALASFAMFARRSQKPAKLVLIGKSEGKEAWVQNMCEKLKISDKVALVGQIPYPKLHEYLFKLNPDAFLFTSYYDNYSWSLLDAMAIERPIIATSVGGTTEILKNRYNALLVPPDPESLCNAMLEMISNPYLTAEISENAFKTVREKHSLNSLCKYEEPLKALLS